MVLNLGRKLVQLILLSRPDWSFIFAGFYFMVALFYALPRDQLFLGWFSMYLVAMGHLSLNGLYDKETDAANPRKWSLMNPIAEGSTLLSKKDVFGWVAVLWSLTLGLNLLLLPHINFIKGILAVLFFLTCVVFSVLYSAPPVRLKGRPFLDLVSTFLVFGLAFATYAAFVTVEVTISGVSIMMSSYIPTDIFFVGLLFNIILLVGIHLPTVLGDLEADKAAGDVTTAVYLGWEHGSIITVIASWARTLGLTIVVTYLALTDILSFFIPGLVLAYALALPDIYFSLRLLRNRNRESTVALWKSIILTSIGGGFVIGFLYFSNNPDLLKQVLALS